MKTIALVLIALLLFSGQCYAGIAELLQKIIYEEKYVMEPDGRERTVLVNRFTDEAEYMWATSKWIKAPARIRYCYKNRRRIRAWAGRHRRRR